MDARVPAVIAEHPEWLEGVKRYLHVCYPQEGCGIFVATGFIPVVNIHPEPTLAFEMPPDVMLEHDVLAIIHSHPDGNAFPSKADMQQQLATDVPWGLVVTSEDGCTDPVWFGDSLPIAPLVGRPFVYGVTDCYALIRDWYRLERGITLKEFPRDWDFWSAGIDMYGEGFGEAGFVELDAAVEPLQPGDVFLAAVRAPVPNHGGVYAGDGMVLHHVQHALSRRSPLHLWAPRITKWLRYRG